MKYEDLLKSIYYGLFQQMGCKTHYIIAIIIILSIDIKFNRIWYLSFFVKSTKFAVQSKIFIQSYVTVT